MTVTLRDAEQLVGRPYVDGVADCGHLVIEAQRVLFGREVDLPLRHPRGRRGQAALIGRLSAVLVQRVATPQSGDVALYLEDDDDGGQHYHLGTVILQGGECWVLHSHATTGASVLQRQADALRLGLRLEGYYRFGDFNALEAA